MVIQRWLAFHPISPSACSRCWILLLGLCFPHRGTTSSRHSWHSCTGWRCRSASSISWLFWCTNAYTRQLRRTLLRNSIRARQRLRSASTSSLVVPRTRLSTIGDRAFPVAAARLWKLEHSAAERHVGVVTVCFRETFEDPSLQSVFSLNLLYSACAATSSFRTL